MSRFRRLPFVVDPQADPVFPTDLEPDADGLIAIGGDLSERVLLEAYRKGIFPWFNAPPLMWFSPDPRAVLFPSGFHASRRLQRTLRQGRFTVRFDQDFEQVMLGCAEAPRPREEGTWIDAGFIVGYTRLYRRHIAHCVAVFREGELAGGLYGVSLGALFFGESMFSLLPDASKVALACLVDWVRKRDFLLIDCQVPTEHLRRLGAVEIPRARFLELLARGLSAPDHHYPWREDGESAPAD
jgi:leucyl/phenylalanyl-tRNA--protein transferase